MKQVLGDTCIELTDSLKNLTEHGFQLDRHGAKHDILQNDAGVAVQVPRHAEIKENLAKGILKKAGII